MDMQALRAEEVAQMLKVSVNFIYRLAKEGTLPSYHVGRKLRFSTDDIEAYLNGAGGSKRSQTSDMEDDSEFILHATTPRRETSLTLAGRGIVADVLANHLDGFGFDVERSYRDGYAALIAVYLGKADLAVVNLWDGGTRSCNIPYVKRLMPGTPCLVLSLGEMASGLIVRKGNPKHIRSWFDLVKPDLTLINREPGSHERILLDEHLILLEAVPSQIAGYDRCAHTELALADLIAHGGADVGVGGEDLFHKVAGIDYLPQQSDEMVLVIRKDASTAKAAPLIRDLLRSRNFQMLFDSAPGIDVKGMGRALYEV